jgi:hypothetical protein
MEHNEDNACSKGINTLDRKVGITSTEIAALWTTYINGSLEICLTTYFLKNHREPKVAGLLKKSLEKTRNNLVQIRDIFKDENFPVPKGYSEQEDVDLSAPPLFFDSFPLSYIYGMSKMGLMNYSMLVTSVAREDIRVFFSSCVQSQLELYNRSVNLMLSKEEGYLPIEMV